MHAFARMINRTDPFAVIDIGVTNGDGESGEFTIYADANQLPRLAAIADAINAAFAEPVELIAPVIPVADADNLMPF
jgi:hypothetical protein